MSVKENKREEATFLPSQPFSPVKANNRIFERFWEEKRNFANFSFLLQWEDRRKISRPLSESKKWHRGYEVADALPVWISMVAFHWIWAKGRPMQTGADKVNMSPSLEVPFGKAFFILPPPIFPQCKKFEISLICKTPPDGGPVWTPVFYSITMQLAAVYLYIFQLFRGGARTVIK